MVDLAGDDTKFREFLNSQTEIDSELIYEILVHPQAVKILLQYLPDVPEDVRGVAIYEGHYETVKLLLAEPRLDEYLEADFYHAIEFGSMKMVKLFWNYSKLFKLPGLLELNIQDPDTVFILCLKCKFDMNQVLEHFKSLSDEHILNLLSHPHIFQRAQKDSWYQKYIIPEVKFFLGTLFPFSALRMWKQLRYSHLGKKFNLRSCN